MRLTTFRTLILTAAALVGVACAEAPSGPRVASTMADATACSATLSGLISQAQVLFGSDAPSYNSVRGKLNNMDQFLRRRRTADAQKRAHEIVEFTLALREDGRITGTDAQVTAFINGVYCYAGIDIVIPDPEDTWFILPSDAPQILYGLDSTVGISLAGLPVFEPSLLRVERFEGRLNTKLDQYPGFIRITLLNDGGTALTRRATITVCATGVDDPAVLERLRLGHGIRDTGFVVTPEPTGSDPVPANVQCSEPAPSGLFARMLGAVRDAFAPTTLEASTATAARRLFGGVSGTVTEFSPFAPIDPVLSFGGGVSGTVTEFSRGALRALESATGTGCSTAPVGTDLSAECQPVVTVRTFNGTVLEGVPVDWYVADDGLGRIAPRMGNLDALTCTTFGTTAATTTTGLGNAGVCWQLGGVGQNRVVAKGRPGGDAPEGVTFDNAGADSVVFAVEVTPVSLSVVSGNDALVFANGSTTASVRAVDAAGAPVAGVHVRWTASPGSTTPSVSVTGADGVASTTWTLPLGANTLTAAVRNASGTAVTFTGTGKPNPDAGKPTNIVIVSGNAQAGLVGEPLSNALTVRVTDNIGTPVAGVPVYWQVLTGFGTLSNATTTTGPDGLASITYAPSIGGNVVKALITQYTFTFVYFDALTGTAP